MGGPKIKYTFLFLYITFATIIPSLMAHIGHYDEVWRRRAEEAKEYARQIYEPHPENVTLAFNQKLRE